MDANWALVILTFVLVIVTGYYAVQNKLLVDQNKSLINEMRKQNAIALFDRILAIFKAVSKLAATLLEEGDVPFAVTNQFAIDVGAASYLLDSADASIISEIINRSVEIGTRAAMLRQMPNGEEKVAMLDRQHKDIQWLVEQERTLKGRSTKYLKMS